MVNWPKSGDSFIQLFNYNSSGANNTNQILHADTANRLGQLTSNLQTVLQHAAVATSGGLVFLEMAWSVNFGGILIQKTPCFYTNIHTFDLSVLDSFSESLLNKKSGASVLAGFPNGLCTPTARVFSSVYLHRTFNVSNNENNSDEPPFGSYSVALGHNLYVDLDTKKVQVVVWWNKPLGNFLLAPAFKHTSSYSTGTSATAALATTNNAFYEYDYEYLSERKTLSSAGPLTGNSLESAHSSSITFNLMIQDIS